MSYDLTVWKWRAGAPRSDVAEILAAFGEDNAHPALTRFDRRDFETALRDAFGDVDDADAPLHCTICDYHSVPAIWAGISIWFSRIDDILPRLIEICESQGLALYDYQREELLVGNI